jgi:hypothetical protein
MNDDDDAGRGRAAVSRLFDGGNESAKWRESAAPQIFRDA